MTVRRTLAWDVDRAPRAPATAIRADLEAWSARGRLWARVCLVTLGAVAVADVVSLGHDLDLARVVGGVADHPGSISAERVLALDQRALPVLVAILATHLLFAVTLLAWIHHAFMTAHRLGGGRWMAFTPASATGSFFVPILNLYRPYVAMVELARASDPAGVADPGAEREEIATVGYRDPALGLPRPPSPRLAPPLAAWWGSWTGCGLLAYLGSRLASTDDLEIAASGAWMLVTADLLGLAATVLVGQVVVRIDARQREVLRRLAISTPETRTVDG